MGTIVIARLGLQNA